ncbi:NADPH-dependent 7-cyano-7-deazaguanine reductase QueF [Coralloluteibacterium thermophilus]|uniref:NADPH-dependent 7-cyano-7-deazaguanine reductase n=1 Tax=Coralloluteibacterium thermophilum TaxID=2707049 RepID=A0ABV9NQ68_9GAMM
MSTPHDSSLGRETPYPTRYQPELLFPIPRATGRAAIGIAGTPPFHGVDIWNGYELSWLDARGKPHVAVATFSVPATSSHLIESKSFKLYLNSLNAHVVTDAEAVRALLARDLSAAAGAPVTVELVPAARFDACALAPLEGDPIDDADVAIDSYGPPQPAFLAADAGCRVEETLVSHLLKSNCPVTGQPDWASVQVRYAGPRIDRAGLLRYLVSFREHADFHEQCVERIFCDLQRHCGPERLSVYARYTRRGGLDINPFRSSAPGEVPPNPRGARQ